MDGVERVKTSHLASRARRWYGQPREEKISLLLLIDEEGSCNFHPYSYTPGILPFMYSSTSEVRSLGHRSKLLEELRTFLAVLTPITLPSRSESGEVLTTYSPQRLFRQFGYDQGAVLVLGSSCIGVWEAEAGYVGASRDALLGDFDSIFWPCRSREGVRSVGGAITMPRFFHEVRHCGECRTSHCLAYYSYPNEGRIPPCLEGVRRFKASY